MSKTTKQGFKNKMYELKSRLLNFAARLQTVAIDFKISSAIGFERASDKNLCMKRLR